jgi:sulfide:quinone oxidoreductase
MTFRDERDTDAYAKVLEELEAGRIRRIAFMLPGGISWPFPIYELALLTGAFAAQHNLSDVELSLVTTATTPLAMFGSDAAKAMADLLEERNVTVYAGYEAHPLEENRLHLAPNGPMLEVDQMIAGPALYGRPVKGLPADNRGFLEIDTHGRVTGAPHVYAAGDITTFPAKQGGIAARQADAVAQTIAAEAGADVTPVPWRPVLQGKLLTGSAPQFVRRDLGLRKDASLLADHALWWPPTKVAGRYLAQVLGTIDADASEALRERQEGVVDVEVELPVSTETPAPDAG